MRRNPVEIFPPWNNRLANSTGPTWRLFGLHFLISTLIYASPAAAGLIQNPILPGFNPDPDIIRVGDDYYIATTTFEWFPGVNIYHSKDLANWRLACRPLSEEHIRLSGVPNSGGNYIPSLAYNERDSLFYLVYSNVLGRDWPLMSMRSYVTTARKIEGPWSDPVYLNSAGFDPALFFAPDGKAYLINMVLDYRSDLQMPGFLLQEYDWRSQKLIGEAKMIFHLENYDKKYRYAFPEGPHLYFHNGCYYLLFAAGGGLPVDFQSLREPMDSTWLSLHLKPGFLSIRGRQPITSLTGQSLVARRWTSLDFEAETALEFQPEHFLQMAGLALFYDTEDFQFAYISHDEKKGRVVRLLQRSKDKGWEKFNEYENDIPEQGQVKFKVRVEDGAALFFFALKDKDFEALGPALSIAHLSDEGVNGDKNGFTGAFVGLSVQDRLYESCWAEIDYYDYRSLAEHKNNPE
ncbi:MAG: family 43 glycosylhydrolase [Phaeodactylibacter sp.]|nr:family 43 glycosylhydrolase [Phaeodactylibacter sp.]